MSQAHIDAGGWCLVCYLCNTSAVGFAHDIFGDAHPNYLAEKAKVFAASPARAIGCLDPNNFRRLMAIATMRHSSQACATFGVAPEELKS